MCFFRCPNAALFYKKKKIIINKQIKIKINIKKNGGGEGGVCALFWYTDIPNPNNYENNMNKSYFCAVSQ